MTASLLMLRNLSEKLARRGIEVGHEAVRDWETKLPPIIGNDLAALASREAPGS